MPRALPHPWIDLGAGVLVRQSRLYRMNSVVLADPGHVAVVDPGILPSEIADLSHTVAGLGTPRTTLVFTHGDWDHVLGRSAWPGARTLGHEAIADDIDRGLDHIRAEASRVATEAGERWDHAFEPFRPDVAVRGPRDDRLGANPAVFREALGHSPSMLSVHLPERRLLIAGDMLSDIEIPILTQPIALYRRTLGELLPLAEAGAFETLIPGHGAIARSAAGALERVRRDLGYLDRLEDEVRSAVAAGLTLDRALALLEGMSLSGWRPDPVVDLAALHRDNVRLLYRELSDDRPAPDAPRA
jgi:glyoxylase-like metal-dependent hydrolase (beta-lactamase superfamily II)